MVKLHKLKCVVIDDEEYARKWLRGKLSTFIELDIIGEAESINEAYMLVAQTRPDVAFMDIQLIGGDVFQLLNRLKEQGIPIPYIVVTTGYSEYVMTALNNYRKYIVYYLVKPLGESLAAKLREAVDALMAAKMNDLLLHTATQESSAKSATDQIYVSVKGVLNQIVFDKIIYLESAGSGDVYFVTDTETLRANITLARSSELLPESHFMRISKTNIVNIRRIVRFDKENREIGVQVSNKAKSLGIGDTYYNDLIKRIPITKESALKAREYPAKQPNALPKDTKPNYSSESTLSDSFRQKKYGMPATKFDLATVMFLNIKGLVKHSGLFSPEELIAEISYLFAAFDNFAKKHRIEKIKTIGDTYLCVGGIPVADTDNPHRMIDMALDVSLFMLNYQKERGAEKRFFFDISMGVHSGSLIASIIDTNQLNYDIWGDVVNITNHVESIGAVGQITISEATYQCVKKKFPCQYIGTIDVEDKTTLDLYQIIVK